ncbi:CDGSH iron-sulfur domain-containing protein [Fodinibius salsisoli]|uniref:CDGSH iron-sulfur domain-containing protein n=1 Tax=Fodinibius salsisoli TaxID=2820877 RepID=A0ABT3PM95_9BACT|nr:CDGSH iron-sulfur domain-containing protein [Fodinibius salsisoli]MCW9707071.1 CDGSH iron-sulfur domain-containing protein [Fodinibius salsisoli]
MKSKIRHYEAADITVEYDQERCIHAAECVKSLPSVFNPDKRPWIQPENAERAQIQEVVRHCPTGALKFQDTDHDEQPEPQNAVIISPDGPVYLRGDIEVQNASGETLLKDTRLALCRCGESQNKPLCDNSHQDISFDAPAAFDIEKLKPVDGEEHKGALVIKLMKNGPALVEGSYQVYSIAGQPARSSKNIALCRCGGSTSKPFCDGTHKDIDFKG